MREITKDDVLNIRRKFEEFTDTAEQSQFPAMVKPDLLLQETIKNYDQFEQKELQSMVRVMCGMLSKPWKPILVNDLEVMMFIPTTDNEEAERWLDSLMVS